MFVEMGIMMSVPAVSPPGDLNAALRADVRYLGSWPTGSVSGAVPPQPDEADRWLARLREGTST